MISRRSYAWLLVIPLAASLTACGNREESTPATSVAKNDDMKEQPVSLFTKVSAQIKACYLNPLDPKLPEHLFNTGTDDKGASEIQISEITPDGQKGPPAYGVRFENGQDDPRGIRTQNIRLAPDVAQDLDADVMRWANGEQGCRRPVRAEAAQNPLPRSRTRIQR